MFIQLYSYFYTWGSWPALPPLSNWRVLNNSNSWRLIFLMSKTGITTHAPHRFWWGLSEKIYVKLFVQRLEHCEGLSRRGSVLLRLFLIWFCLLSWARPLYRSCWIRLYSRGVEEKMKLEVAETISRDYSFQDFGEVEEKVFRRGGKVPSKGREKPVMSHVFKCTRVCHGVSILHLFCVFPNGQSYRFEHDLVQYEKTWQVRDFQNKYSIIG